MCFTIFHSCMELVEKRVGTALPHWFCSEFSQDAEIQLSAREIVWDGILLVGHVGNPVIRVHVVDAKEVEAVHTKPDVAKWVELLLFVAVVVHCAVTHSYVGTLIGWCSEI